MENEELFTKINELFPPDFSKENLELYVDYIQCCYNFSIISNDFDFSSLINYISSNFYSLPEEKFLKLPLEMQYSIISNPHLQIASEDSLLDTVMQIINGIDDNSLKSQDEIEKVLFLEHIEFTSLSDDWIILDSRNNVDSLNNSLAIETFDIKENIDDNEYFRYFRIRQTGLNCSNTNQLAFCSLELFGTII